jgi:hypothetical protein
MEAAEMDQGTKSELGPPAKKQKSHSKHADNGSDKNKKATPDTPSATKP